MLTGASLRTPVKAPNPIPGGKSHAVNHRSTQQEMERPEAEAPILREADMHDGVEGHLESGQV